MKRAILKTLAYADIFDYPLKAYEIHKWIISKRASLQEVQKGLSKLTNEGRIGKYKDYYFLPKRGKQVLRRIKNAKLSRSLMFRARFLTQILKIIPWIKLVGVSGGLAMENAGKKDDIDLFLITSRNRLWLSRLFATLVLTLLTVRRSRKTKSVSGKFCLNIFLTEDDLKQQRKDLYTAHEILQMKPLWQRDGIYKNFLEKNDWAFKHLPNWVGVPGSALGRERHALKGKTGRKGNSPNAFADMLEILAKKMQLWYMKAPEGMERIWDGALYFHPQDYNPKILKEYKNRLKSLTLRQSLNAAF